MINFLKYIGSLYMRLLCIPEPVAVQTEEMILTPSEDRSFINFDQYDPTQLQRNRSER